MEDQDARIAVIPLRAPDLPLLHRWRNAEHVARWWNGPISLEGLEARLLPRIEGREPTHPHLALLDGRPIGYVSVYRWRDHAHDARLVRAPDDATGLDLYIGEPELTGLGWGPRIIRAALAMVAYRLEGVDACLSTPDVRNAASIRAFEKAGFRREGEAVEADGTEVARMLIRRV